MKCQTKPFLSPVEYSSQMWWISDNYPYNLITLRLYGISKSNKSFIKPLTNKLRYLNGCVSLSCTYVVQAELLYSQTWLAQIVDTSDKVLDT